MAPHWRAKKKSEWDMGTYETTELDHKAIDWCIKNDIKIAPFAKQAGAWYNLIYKDGTSEKFQASKWLEKMQNEKFEQRVLELMDEEIILKFENKSGEAKNFYDVDEEE